MRNVLLITGAIFLLAAILFFTMGWYALVPGCIIVGMAIMTRRALEPLIIGCSVGFVLIPFYGNRVAEAALFPHGASQQLSFPSNMLAALEDTIARDAHNYGFIWVILICLLFGSLIQLLIASGGIHKLVKVSARFVKSQRDTLLMTMVLSILLFIDDFLNALTVGNTMRPIALKQKVSRQKLAMMLGLLVTPVVTLVPISTWTIFYGSQLLTLPDIAALHSNPVSAFASAIPFNFAAWISLIVALLVIFHIIPDFKAMRQTELSEKKLLENLEETAMDVPRKTPGKLWHFFVPIGVLLFFSLFPFPNQWDKSLLTLDGLTSNIDALRGVSTAFVFTYLLFLFTGVMTFNELSANFIKGMESMTFVMVMLAFTYLLKEVQDVLGFNELVTNKLTGLVNPKFLPAALFAVVASITWATSSSWGLYAILIPLTAALCQHTGAHFWLVQGALASGTVWGNAACLFSDNRLLISQATGLNMIVQGIVQLPYQIIIFFASLAAFLVVGLMY